MDTNKIFPIKTHEYTDYKTKKVTIIHTRQGSYEGRIWTDADINYYEAMTKMISRIEFNKQKEIQDQINALCDDSFELV